MSNKEEPLNVLEGIVPLKINKREGLNWFLLGIVLTMPGFIWGKDAWAPGVAWGILTIAGPIWLYIETRLFRE